MSKELAFDEGVKAFGSMSALATALEVSIQTLSNWRARGVPPNQCMRFQELTSISVRRLRPDDWHAYWPEPKPASLPVQLSEAL